MWSLCVPLCCWATVVSIAQAMLDEVAIATATGVEVSMGAPTRSLLLATQLVFYAIVPIIGTDCGPHFMGPHASR